MNGAVLVDTSVWIDHLRGRPSVAAAQLAAWLADEPDFIVVNEVVATELARGFNDESEALELLNALDKLPQADPLQRADWLQSASLYRRCRRAGLTVRSPMDCLIAAHALRLQLPLLAIDRDFEAIATQAPLLLFKTAAA
jgi:hypothetical protein